MSKVDDLMFEGGTLFHNSESDDVQYYRQHENPIEAITPPPPLGSDWSQWTTDYCQLKQHDYRDSKI